MPARGYCPYQHRRLNSCLILYESGMHADQGVPEGDARIWVTVRSGCDKLVVLGVTAINPDWIFPRAARHFCGHLIHIHIDIQFQSFHGHQSNQHLRRILDLCFFPFLPAYREKRHFEDTRQLVLCQSHSRT